MYDFVTGPLAWIAFLIFFLGLIWRFIWYIKGLDWRLDRLAYTAHPWYGIKGAIRSIFFWLIPYGTRSWRYYSGFTVLVFIFHLCLLITPVFLLGHNELLRERWGFSLPTLPEALADAMTATLLLAALFIVVRRVAVPQVRALTTAYDMLLMVIAVAPFVTGFIAYHQVGHYQFWLILHILCGEIMLVAIPWTKLSHFLLFFLSRAQLGMDFGIKRGGMKSKGMPW